MSEEQIALRRKQVRDWCEARGVRPGDTIESCVMGEVVAGEVAFHDDGRVLVICDGTELEWSRLIRGVSYRRIPASHQALKS